MKLHQPSKTNIARFRFSLITILLSGVLLAGCGPDKDAAGQEENVYNIGTPLSDQSLAAVVSSEYGTDTLTTSQFRNKIAVFVNQYPQIESSETQLRQLRRGLIEDFAIQHALLGEAAQMGISADTAVVLERINAFRAQFPDDASFLQTLATNNIPEDSLFYIIKDALIQELLFERYQQGVADPTEDEIERFRSEQAEEIRAQHILFLTGQDLSQEEEDLIQQRAKAVLDSIEAGIDFADLARRHSEDGSAQMGGDLGFFKRGLMVAPFEKAAFALADPGDVTKDLVRTQYGYHIIRLTGRRIGDLPDATNALQSIMRKRHQEAVENNLNELRTKLTVHLNETVVDAELNADQ